MNNKDELINNLMMFINNAIIKNKYATEYRQALMMIINGESWIDAYDWYNECIKFRR